MTTQELSAQLGKVQSTLQADFPKWANYALGNSALEKIKGRIINSGAAAEGNFKPYSTRSTLVGASSFRTKAQATAYFGTRGPKNKKSKALEWRTVNTNKGYRSLAILPGGYKQLRNLVGAESGFKNFTWSGEMWFTIRTQGTEPNGNLKWTTTVGSKIELTNKKLEGNAKREGKEILELSKKEEGELLVVLNEYVANKLQKVING